MNYASAPASPAAVINIQPDGNIYDLGVIPGEMHVYNVNNPPSGNPTHYELTIVDVNYWNVYIQPGHTHTYPAGGNAVYIRNLGASRLQVLYAAASAEADEKSQKLLSLVAGVGR